MFRLLSFLISNQNLILFLALEGIAVALIVSYNDHQRHIFGDGLLEVSSGIYEKRANVADYFNLSRENRKLKLASDSLRQELNSLRGKLETVEGIATTMDSSFQESIGQLLSKEGFEFVPCRAIKNTTIHNYNYITLDKGSRHGIKPNMGVISPEGVAGKVIRVSENFSLALSVINVSFKLSAKIADISGEDNQGLYEWTGASPKYGKLRYLPDDIVVDSSARVVTTGYSTVFPEGVTLGYVQSSSKNSQSGQLEIEVALATDFQSLGSLYLIKASHLEEVEKLEENLNQ